MANRNHYRIHLADVLGAKGPGVGRIDHYRIGYELLDCLHLVFVDVNSNYFGALLRELTAYGGTKLAQSNYGKFIGHGLSLFI